MRHKIHWRVQVWIGRTDVPRDSRGYDLLDVRTYRWRWLANLMAPAPGILIVDGEPMDCEVDISPIMNR